jgi:hypothetical protein
VGSVIPAVAIGLGLALLLNTQLRVIPMGPVTQWVGERPTDSLTVVVAPFEEDGRTELRVPLDGREVAVRYQASGGRHLLGAPAGVELGP